MSVATLANENALLSGVVLFVRRHFFCNGGIFMKRKILTFLAAVAMLACAAFGLTACGSQGTDGLAYYPLPDGTYAVGKGNTHYLENIVIPSTYNGKAVSAIAESGFESAEMKNITIPNSITSIDYCAFRYCSSLTSITIPDSVTSIGGNAFYYCSSLTSITIPDSVTSIDSFTFFGCSSLTIYCEAASKPSSWYVLGNPVVWDCNNNDVADDGYIYVVMDNVRYALKNGVATVVRQANSIQTATIPVNITYKGTVYNVTSIGESAFDYCRSLTSVTIGNGITSIGSSAFGGCSGLTSVYYKGTAEDWAKISIGLNYNLEEATRYYYSEIQPTTTGKYWRYVDGVPTAW